MPVFLRQLYKQKPQQWGSFDYVQGLLFERAAKIGINPEKIELAYPFWEMVGKVHDYGRHRISENIGSSMTWGKKQLRGGTVYDDVNNVINLGSVIDPRTWDGISIIVNASFITPPSGAYPGILTNCASGRYYDNFNLTYEHSSSSAIMIKWRPGQNDTGITKAVNIGGTTKTVAGTWIRQGRAVIYIDTEAVISDNLLNDWDTINYNTYFNGYYRYNWRTSFHYYNNILLISEALRLDQITFLSDNPYYFWQPYHRITYFVPSGTITIKNISDTGTGSDLISQVINSLSISDTGTGVDLFGDFNASLSIPDTGSAIDSNPSTSVSFSVSDTGSAIDTITQVLSSLIISDSGSAIDTITNIIVAFSLLDSGSGSDFINLLTESLKNIQDSGSGTDSINSKTSLSLQDSGSAIDIISQTLISLLIQDSGSGTENLSLLTELLKIVQDVGTGTDSISSPVISLSISDSAGAIDIIDILNNLTVSDLGSASEIINAIKTKFIQIQDSGIASDGLLVSVGVTISDISSATDIVKQVLSSLAILDTGSGTDLVIKTDFNLLPKGIVKVTFTMKVPDVDSSIKVPGVNFTLN